jgi:hypothetical protein
MLSKKIKLMPYELKKMAVKTGKTIIIGLIMGKYNILRNLDNSNLDF